MPVMKKSRYEVLMVQFLVDFYYAKTGRKINPNDVTRADIRSFQDIRNLRITGQGILYIETPGSDPEFIEMDIPASSIGEFEFIANQSEVSTSQWSPEFAKALTFLCEKYSNIKKWAQFKPVINISLYREAGRISSPCKVKVDALFDNNRLESETFLVAVDDLVTVEAIMAGGSPLPSTSASRELEAIMPTIPKHAREQRCEVKFEEIPPFNFIKTKEQPSGNPSWLTYAFRCSCSDSFLCSRITNIIEDYGDTGYWSSKVKSLNGGFRLVVPVYGHVLYSFPIETREVPDWSGKSKRKLIAYGTSENETFFYDAPHYFSKPQACSMMPDQLRMLRDLADNLATKWKETLVDFATGKTTITCQSKNHTYGDNQKFRKFLTTSERELSASLLVLELYKMCYPCYHKSTPAFSLLENDFKIN